MQSVKYMAPLDYSENLNPINFYQWQNRIIKKVSPYAPGSPVFPFFAKEIEYISPSCYDWFSIVK